MIKIYLISNLIVKHVKWIFHLSIVNSALFLAELLKVIIF